MTEKKPSEKELRAMIDAFKKSHGEMSLSVMYMQFDLDATRRERDHWKEKYARS